MWVEGLSRVLKNPLPGLKSGASTRKSAGQLLKENFATLFWLAIMGGEKRVAVAEA
jgi:hypothetical protein